MLDFALVQLADLADLAEHFAAEAHAVLDLRGGAHVEHGTQHVGVFRCRDVDGRRQRLPLFSRFAIQRAAVLVAPRSDKANTDAPLAAGVRNASA